MDRGWRRRDWREEFEVRSLIYALFTFRVKRILADEQQRLRSLTGRPEARCMKR
jgi:hypothetical protein